MTVSTTPNKITYAANGVTTAWSFSFSILDSPNMGIIVFLTDPNGNVIEIPPSQFTVVVNPEVGANPTAVGGIVNYPLSGPPLAVGWRITLYRNANFLQSNSISNQSIIYPPVIEQEFDYLTMMIQELLEAALRTVRAPVTEAGIAPLPTAEQRANQQAVFDASGNLTAGGAVIGTIISPAMVPVVTASTLPAARTAMGVPPVDSPAFTGNPTAPTAPLNDNDATVATTAFVQNQLSGIGAQFPSGTRMLFQQTAAPIGWTKDVSLNDRALRVVNGTVTGGGSQPFSSIFAQTTTQGYAITTAEMPIHNHAVSDPGHAHTYIDPGHGHNNSAGGGTFMSQDSSGGGFGGTGNNYNNLSLALAQVGISIQSSFTSISLFNTGGGQPHLHGMELRVLYTDVIIAQRN